MLARSLVYKRLPLQVLLLIVVVAGAIAVISVAKNWGDWVVFGAIVVTFFGAGIAIYPRRYTARKRTFVRSSKPPTRRR
jgi:membrane protein YdbS with pleckstrin-like domain